MRRLVLNMADKRPVWAMPAWAEAEIRAALPPGWEVVALRAPVSGEGDGGGAGGVTEQALAAVAGAEVYMGMGLPRAIFLAASTGPEARMRWVHTGSAGVGAALFPEMRASPVLLTNSAGVMGPPMAETVMAMVLYFARGFDLALESARRREWIKDAIYESDSPVREIGDATMGVVGYGGVGREVARRARALGMRVLATRRAPAGAQGEIEVLSGDEGLRRLLAESDYVALTVPATPETAGLIGRAQLALMKPTSVLINVARGSIVDESALIEALRARRLRGAGLDVFAREPLPSDSPLWTMPNVLITPHVSAVSPGYWRRETDLIVENLRRYLAGRELLNVVHKERGY
jgi:phosphoglycerate dehydrogenase-like enzyme